MAEPALKLYLYQRRFIQDQARYKLAKFSRQAGKTMTITLEIVDDCYTREAGGGKARWVILSRGERQAREAMEEWVKPHAKAYGAAIEELEYDFVVDTAAGATYRALEVVLPGGSKITALPANPDTARGFSASVFLDEFAIHKDSREIWGAVFPIASKRGLKIRVASTPKGKNNKFYELDTCDDPIWSRHSVTIHQAIADGLDRNADELKRALGDDELWRQEYLCEYVDEATAWLPYELIFACEDDAAGEPAGYQGGPCFIGNDIAAGGGDLWVAWVAEMVGDVLWTREIVTRRRASFAEQDEIMDELFRTYKVVRLAMDQTGMGEKPVEDAKRRYDSNRVEGVLFTAPAKIDLAGVGKRRFEDRRIRVPAGDTALRADLHSLVKVLGPTGGVRFVAERDGGSHADRTWACFLCCHAAALGGTPIAYRASGAVRPALAAWPGGTGAYGTGAGGTASSLIRPQRLPLLSRPRDIIKAPAAGGRS